MENIINLTTMAEYEKLLAENDAVCLYFSTPECNVCKVLKPKLIEFLGKEFPKIKFAYVSIPDAPEVSGQLTVFTVPTVLFFFGGREFYRVSRNLSIDVLREELNRPYSMLFEE